MTKNSPAGFWIRALASLIDAVIFITLHFLSWFYITSAAEITELVSRIALYIVLIFLPHLVFGFLYGSLMIHYFGATLGKLLSGLKVITENSQLLSLKRALFRQTVGYNFSALFFGLGYFAIARDQEKRAWHDKAVDSRVVVTKKLWPLGLAILALLIAFNVYLAQQSVKNWVSNDLSGKFMELLITPGPTELPEEPLSTAQVS